MGGGAVISVKSGEGYLFHQDQPARLCCDRELSTSEIHESNDFYGQASVLKRYVGYPTSYALKAVLEHAPVVQENMWQQDRRARLPVNFSCTQLRADQMRKYSGRPSFPIGFGFLYAAKLVESTHGAVVNRRGTVVFPFKSTHHFATEFDHVDYAKRLAALPDWMQPMTICIFWKDYLRGVYQAYVDQGQQIVTAGHMYDAEFLLRLYDICRRFRFAVSNEFGTHVFATVASGCPHSFVESGAIKRDIPAEYRRDYVRDMPGFLQVRDQCRALFSGGLHRRTTRDQRRFVDEILGTDFVRSPSDLRWLINQAECRDKFWTFSRCGDHPMVKVIPAFYRRQLRQLRQRWKPSTNGSRAA